MPIYRHNRYAIPGYNYRFKGTTRVLDLYQQHTSNVNGLWERVSISKILKFHIFLVDIHGYSWIVNGNPWKFIDIDEKNVAFLTSWTFMYVHEVPRISMDFHGLFCLGYYKFPFYVKSSFDEVQCHSSSHKIVNGNPWKFIDIDEKNVAFLTSWTFMYVHEVPRISMDFHGLFCLGYYKFPFYVKSSFDEVQCHSSSHKIHLPQYFEMQSSYPVYQQLWHTVTV